MTSSRSRVMLLALLSLCSFMGMLDTTIVNVSLPVIGSYFHVGTGETSLVVVAYMLFGTSLMLLFGFLGEKVGYRRLFVAGLSIFTVASLMCAMSMQIWGLIAWRALQGIGEAMFVAIIPAMVFDYFPEEERTRCLAIITSMGAGAAVAGPVLGGVLTHFLSWHWIFILNVPIGLIGLSMAAKLIPSSTIKRTEHFDLLGPFIIMAGMVLTIVFLNHGEEWGWTSVETMAVLAAAVAAWFGLICWERRVKDAILDLKLFRDRGFALGNLACFLMMAVWMGTLFLLPFYYQGNRGLSPLISGLLMLPPAVASVALGLCAEALCERFGEKMVAKAAALTAILVYICLVLLSGSDADPIWLWVLVTSLLGGVLGLFYPIIIKIVMSHCPMQSISSGSSVATMFESMGETAGVAVFEAIFSFFAPVGLMLMAGSSVGNAGFVWAFIVGTVFATVSFVALLLSPKHPAHA